jgi:hypothetical protein
VSIVLSLSFDVTKCLPGDIDLVRSATPRRSAVDLDDPLTSSPKNSMRTAGSSQAGAPSAIAAG